MKNNYLIQVWINKKSAKSCICATILNANNQTSLIHMHSNNYNIPYMLYNNKFRCLLLYFFFNTNMYVYNKIMQLR